MRREEFKPLMARIAAWWPATKWTEAMIAVWFEDLQRFPAAAVRQALERLKREHTSPFAPAIGAVLALLERPHIAPTFDEAYELIYGHGGILRAKMCGDTPKDIHPLVASFAQRQGIERLSTLAVDHPQHGELVRKDLRAAYERHLEASEGREVAALAAGSGEPRRLDPLSAIPRLERSTP